MSDIMYIKLNQDDIMSIVCEVVAEKTKIKEFATRGMIVGEISNDLRMIIAVSDSYDELKKIDLMEMDKKLNYNGVHSGEMGFSNAQLSAILDDMIKSGDF